MKTIKTINSVIIVVLIAAALMFATSCQKENSINPESINQIVAAKSSSSYVFQPNAHMYGASYSVWSARWWKWDLELPLACHPSLDESCFDVSAGQSGDVWFLGTPVTGAPVERTITIPTGKALYIGTLNVESSDLEAAPFYGATETERRAIAKSFADVIINMSFTVDGVSVDNTGNYRVPSAQIDFTAPTPWIFGDVGGNGKSVGDGYFFMVKPLSSGSHTISYSGTFHFGEGNDLPVDMTYHVMVQ